MSLRVLTIPDDPAFERVFGKYGDRLPRLNPQGYGLLPNDRIAAAKQAAQRERAQAMAVMGVFIDEDGHVSA